MTDVDQIRTDIDAESLPHDRLQQALRYWNLRRGNRAMPSRPDIDPLDIPYLLSSLMIIDCSHDGARAVIRLAGTRIVDKFNFDPTGRDLYRIPEIGSLSALCRSTASRAAPAYVEGELSWSTMVHRPYCAVCMPLSTNGTDVDKLLVSFHFPEWQDTEDAFDDRPALHNRGQ